MTAYLYTNQLKLENWLSTPGCLTVKSAIQPSAPRRHVPHWLSICRLRITLYACKGNAPVNVKEEFCLCTQSSVSLGVCVCHPKPNLRWIATCLYVLEGLLEMLKWPGPRDVRVFVQARLMVGTSVCMWVFSLARRQLPLCACMLTPLNDRDHIR